MTDPRLYPAHIVWSDEDKGFIATAPDLPGSSAFGETEAEALHELRTVIALGLAGHKAVGNPIPKPGKASQPTPHSGRLLLRMPKSLHRILAEEAERDGVSLNQYLLYRLARGDVPHNEESRTILPVQHVTKTPTEKPKLKRQRKRSQIVKSAA